MKDKTGVYLLVVVAFFLFGIAAIESETKKACYEALDAFDEFNKE